MFILRTLSFRDVVHALQERKVGVAIDISKNLVSNAVNTAKFRIRLHPRFPPAVPDSAQGAEAAVNSRAFWVVRAITGVAGLGLQLAGLYALYIAFGAWLTLGLYAVGGLALVLQQVVMRRVTSCSLGD